MKKNLIRFLSLPLAAVLIYSGHQAWQIHKNYSAEANMHRIVLEYKPEQPASVNQSVIDLQAIYPDAVGWLSVENTAIDYPFVWYKDDDFYLRRDLDGNHAMAGTIFMDHRCEKDVTSQNTILYGHNMRNGSMFGALNSFAQKNFFDENRNGTIFLPHATLTLEFFAYMVIRADDAEIYSVALGEDYFDYVQRNARHYRPPALTNESRVVTLSACSYEFKNARMVLLGIIVKDN